MWFDSTGLADSSLIPLPCRVALRPRHHPQPASGSPCSWAPPTTTCLCACLTRTLPSLALPIPYFHWGGRFNSNNASSSKFNPGPAAAAAGCAQRQPRSTLSLCRNTMLEDEQPVCPSKWTSWFSRRTSKGSLYHPRPPWCFALRKIR